MGSGNTAAHVPLPPRRDPDPTPLAPGRYQLQVTINQSTRDKLGQLQDLLAHQIPNGDVAVILECGQQKPLKVREPLARYVLRVGLHELAQTRSSPPAVYVTGSGRIVQMLLAQALIKNGMRRVENSRR